MRISWRAPAILLLAPIFSPAAHLSRPAEQAFESYVTKLEARLAGSTRSHDTCVAMLPPTGAQRADAERKLLGGTVLVEPVHGGSWEVDGGLLHHWHAGGLRPWREPEKTCWLFCATTPNFRVITHRRLSPLGHLRVTERWSSGSRSSSS